MYSAPPLGGGQAFCFTYSDGGYHPLVGWVNAAWQDNSKGGRCSMKRQYTGPAALVAFLVAGAAQAASVDVFVGYADNLRASGFFPTPWLGGTGVVSQTGLGGQFDSGAIRIDNNTGSP